MIMTPNGEFHFIMHRKTIIKEVTFSYNTIIMVKTAVYQPKKPPIFISGF